MWSEVAKDSLQVFRSLWLRSGFGSSSFLRPEDIDRVAGLHVQASRCDLVLNPATIEEEASLGGRGANLVAEGLLQLLHLSSLPHPEVDLVAALIDDLQVDELCLARVHLEIGSVVA